MSSIHISPRSCAAVVMADGIPSVTSMFRTSEAHALGFTRVLKVSRNAGGIGYRDCVAPGDAAAELAGMPEGAVVVFPRARRLTQEVLDAMPAPEPGMASHEPRFEDCGAVAMLRDDAVAWMSGRRGKPEKAQGPARRFADLVDRDACGGRPPRKGRTIVGLASYPARESGMLAVVAALSPQCDEMHVALNEYEGEALERVLGKLSKYPNVHAKAYVGEEDLGCQNKFRAVDLCGPDDYFLTVDDDLLYPCNYVDTAIDSIDRIGKESFVSFHGSRLKRSGSAGVEKQVILFGDTCHVDTRTHLAGTGAGICVPGKIGLSFDVFNKPKNTGDDELLAIWARDNSVKLFVAAHPKTWITVNRTVEKVDGLWRSDESMADRLGLLSVSGEWPNLEEWDAAHPFFTIIVPVHGSKTLERALLSVAGQKFSSYVVSVCDDRSPEADADRNSRAVRSILGRKGVFSRTPAGRVFAGSARNVAMTAAPESEYTLFLDADDVFTYENMLGDLHKFILRNGMPDTVVLPFFHHSGRSTVQDAAQIDTPEKLSVWRYVAPWSKCIRTRVCPAFQENVRRANDVLQHLKTADSVATVVPFNKECVRYMMDGETTMYGYSGKNNSRSADAVGSILTVAGQILSEEWRHDYMRCPGMCAWRLKNYILRPWPLSEAVLNNL